MNILTSDFETTTHNKGSAFDPRNRAVCLGYKLRQEAPVCVFLEDGKLSLPETDLHIGFNFKFELHWYRRLGLEVSNWKVWDCQIAEYIISGQTWHIALPPPERLTLNNVAAKYGLGSKIDVVKEEYWEKGVCTTAIPRDILSSYCRQDVDLTYQVYLKQQEYLADKPQMKRLISLACQDLLVLQEMEWNGMVYDEQLCTEREQQLASELVKIQTELGQVYPDLSINFNSGDQLSAFLYGGMLFRDGKEHIGFYKSGEKKGQPKYKNIVIEHKLPRLVEPLKGSETKKEGFFKTDEATLKKLKGPAAKKFVGPLLEMARLEKLLSMTYKGIPEKNKMFNFKSGLIHAKFNQCRTSTGRLSASDPNIQQIPGEAADIFVTRF